MKESWQPRGKNGQTGQSITEFALILPIVLLLLFGMIEFGRLLEADLVLTSAAREGARYGSLGKSTAEIQAGVRQSASYLNTPQLTITITNAQGQSGQPVTVQVSYPITISTPLIANILPSNPVVVTADATMRLE